MSKASQYIILCEDILHEVFVRRFLRNYNVTNREILSIPLPVGTCCGEQHVRKNYPDVIRVYRARQSKAKTVLLVVIDADTGTVENRQSQLDDAVDVPRSDSELIVYLIPKRHIETWLAFLDNYADVDEATDYKSKYGFRGKERESHPLTDKFTEMFRHRQSPPESLPSLKQALYELERILECLR